MRLTETLQREAAAQDSYFMAQLAREDLARLEKLRALAKTVSDVESFKKAGSRVGWTAGDLRTGELREPLERFLEAMYALEHASEPRGDTDAEAAVEAAWRDLHRARMERLLGCLSTPVPKPSA